MARILGIVCVFVVCWVGALRAGPARPASVPEVVGDIRVVWFPAGAPLSGDGIAPWVIVGPPAAGQTYNLCLLPISAAGYDGDGIDSLHLTVEVGGALCYDGKHVAPPGIWTGFAVIGELRNTPPGRVNLLVAAHDEAGMIGYGDAVCFVTPGVYHHGEQD